MLQFCGFYLKSWESLDKEHTVELNLDLPKEITSDKTVRHRPVVSDTHKEIHRLQKTQTSDDEPLIKKEESELPSVTQLGCTLTQWNYRIKSRVASYQKRTNQKVIFHSYDEAEKHLELNLYPRECFVVYFITSIILPTL